jgi:hypothetical protein
MSTAICTLDMLPVRCAVEFTFCGPLLCAVAKNIDTGVTGPLVAITPENPPEIPALHWSELDPDHVVAVARS